MGGEDAMKSLVPLLTSAFGSLFPFSKPGIHPGRTLRGRIHDLMSLRPVQVDVRVAVYYYGDLVKDGRCKVVNGAFTVALNKEGCYTVFVSADGYVEIVDTVWVLREDRSVVEKEYFMWVKEPATKIDVSPDTTPGYGQLDYGRMQA
jgi:hypothetical protein